MSPPPEPVQGDPTVLELADIVTTALIKSGHAAGVSRVSHLAHLQAELLRVTTALEEMTQAHAQAMKGYLNEMQCRVANQDSVRHLERDLAALREEHETLKERHRALLAEPSEPFMSACLQGDREALKQALATERAAHAQGLREAIKFIILEQAAPKMGVWGTGTLDEIANRLLAAYLASRDGGTAG